MRAGPVSRRGFTLIEVIITLVLLGILAVMMGPYLVRSVSQSSTPLENLKKEISLQACMEDIIYNYNKSYTSNLAGLQTYVTTKASGNYTIVKNGYVSVDASNAFVDSATATKYFLVTIKSLTTGEQLTTLFTSS